MRCKTVYSNTRHKTAFVGTTSTCSNIALPRKIVTAFVALFLLFTAGCSTVERVVYRPNIDQGNYLVAGDVAKVHTGMTQQQVAYTLGTPLLTDPFGSDTWYYVFRQQPGHQRVKQQTLILTFNDQGVLTHIDNKPQLTR